MKRAFAVALLVTALIAGCSKPEDKFVGKWNGRFEFPPEVIEMIKGLAAMAPPDQRSKVDNFEEEIKKVKLDFELKRDGTYSLTTSGSETGEAQQKTGTWKLSEDMKTVTLSAPQMSAEEKKKANDAGVTDAMLEQAGNQEMAFKVADETAKSMVYEQSQMGITMKIILSR